ncbi:hypothetical protein CB1_001026008 [Camelus ferus]|nr:hypothetical protein CB1_001026008 [Camelus ferus]
MGGNIRPVRWPHWFSICLSMARPLTSRQFPPPSSCVRQAGVSIGAVITEQISLPLVATMGTRVSKPQNLLLLTRPQPSSWGLLWALSSRIMASPSQLCRPGTPAPQSLSIPGRSTFPCPTMVFHNQQYLMRKQISVSGEGQFSGRRFAVPKPPKTASAHSGLGW